MQDGVCSAEYIIVAPSKLTKNDPNKNVIKLLLNKRGEGRVGVSWPLRPSMPSVAQSQNRGSRGRDVCRMDVGQWVAT